jgi:methylated-DNA-[protein]-cysteine S-methyltransferase
VSENPATARSQRAVKNAEKAVFEIVRYISGQGFDFETPIDLSWATPFMKNVYRTLQKEVPYGETISYGDLAWLSGNPGSARAVGLAMARNRTPLMIPCHRVKHASGKIGGWSGRPGWKEKLLNHENRVCKHSALSLSV